MDMEGERPMWTVVYVAPNDSIAQMLKDVLEQEGLLVMLRRTGVPHMGASGNFELLVPETEAEEAHEIVTSVLAR